jgi:hypothetical protein
MPEIHGIIRLEAECMRLDSLGKPLLVQLVESDRVQAQEKKAPPLPPVTQSPEAGTSMAERGPRLGHIIDLLENAKKQRKKAISKQQVKEAIQKYRFASLLVEAGNEVERKTGQTLDQKA